MTKLLMFKVCYIGESVKLTDDLLEFADQKNLDGIIFAGDSVKT